MGARGRAHDGETSGRKHASKKTRDEGFPPAVTRLKIFFDEARPEAIIRSALGGEVADEIVPSADGINTFRGERALRSKTTASSLLGKRLARIQAMFPE